MGKKIWAFIAFNVYSLFLISAFQENTRYLFDPSLIKEMRLRGIKIDPREWGWGDHYIWRLFSGVVVTAIAGFLVGAIAKTKGAKTAAISNILSVLVWTAMIYLFGFTEVQIGAQTGFIVISIIAIPLTTYVAYWAGRFGEEVQRSDFSDDTVLGIKGYHWIWAVFPLYWYGLGIVFVATKFIGFQFATWGDIGIIATIISLLTLAPIVAWIYPLWLVYRILKGDLLSSKNAAVKGVTNISILILGMFVAAALQFASYWILGKMIS